MSAADLYLILHKVRGEPAFDVAAKLCKGPAPCQPNCGQWDGQNCRADKVWIIPTSGHRAYPMWQMELTKLDVVYNNALCQWRPDQFRDHYAASEPRATPVVKRVKPATQTEDFIV